MKSPSVRGREEVFQWQAHTWSSPVTVVGEVMADLRQLCVGESRTGMTLQTAAQHLMPTHGHTICLVRVCAELKLCTIGLGFLRLDFLMWN